MLRSVQATALCHSQAWQASEGVRRIFSFHVSVDNGMDMAFNFSDFLRNVESFHRLLLVDSDMHESVLTSREILSLLPHFLRLL